MEDLENNLQEYGALCVVDRNIWLCAEHGRVGYLDQHLNAALIANHSVSPIYQVIIQGIHESLSKAVLVLGKDSLESWKNSKDYVRHRSRLLNEVLKNDEDLVLDSNPCWINHKLKYWHVD